MAGGGRLSVHADGDGNARLVTRKRARRARASIATHGPRWLALLLLLAGCSRAGDGETYTLYRNSVLDNTARYHVATFDSADGDKYNQRNCDLARMLFQEQPGVRTRFWCENGPFRK